MNSTIIKNDMITESFIMPDEGSPHTATWMAYGPTKGVWGATPFNDFACYIARKDIIRVIANISRFEKVNVLVNEEDLNEAKMFLSQVSNEISNVKTKGKYLPDIEASGRIEFIKQPINDIWLRDTGPLFVFDYNKNKHGINFNFNGWGQENTGNNCWEKCRKKVQNNIQEKFIKKDQQVADFLIKYTGVTPIKTWLVMEGGGIEVNGNGTAICTESSILNPNRNPGKSKEEVEKELFRLLGIKKVIWLPGLKGMEITDGHVDFYARFIDESKVFCTLDKNEGSLDFPVTHEHLRILSNATDANENKLTVIPLVSPDYSKVEEAVNFRNGLFDTKSFFTRFLFAAGYVGYYLANNCVLMSMFGDEKADEAAFDLISELYPERTVMQMTSDGIGYGGGTIHCVTQQQI